MKTRLVIVLSLVFVLAALPAAAEIYTITMADGGEFESRQEPKEVDWDDDLVMVLTDVGNWIALEKADVVSVEVDTENRGFGKVIDAHTISLGWAPNDNPVDDPEAALDPMTRLLSFLENEQANRPDYSVDQFVEPGQAGGQTGGLPVSGVYSGTTAFPVGGGSSGHEPDTVDQ